MAGRKREINRGAARSQHLRVVPVWKPNIDQRQLAKVLILLSLHQAGGKTAKPHKSTKGGTS